MLCTAVVGLRSHRRSIAARSVGGECCPASQAPNAVVALWDDLTTPPEQFDIEIWHGVPTVAGTYPWAVAFTASEKDDKVFCGGSLIGDKWVLTAAHCCVTAGASFAIVGRHDLDNVNQGRPIRVADVIAHENYNCTTHANDIALVKLSTSSGLKQFARLGGQSDAPGVKVVIVGWGRTEHQRMSPRLMQAQVPLIGIDRCRDIYRQRNDTRGATLDGELFLCGLDPNLHDPQDACNGDSGGPAFVPGDHMETLVGVISMGVGCGDYPGIYTRLSRYQGWITAVESRVGT
jgi:secreted trypsin-like serine protease